MINHINLLNSIKDYLTRFQLLVKISNANNEFDINHHSENIIIPLLNVAFKANFKNVNEVEKKNFESLDLIDDENKIGIQVTSSSNIEKIKVTLSKFLKYGHDKRVNKVFVYILTEKQRSYSYGAIQKIIKGKIEFDPHTQIIDAKDIYRRIKSLNSVSVFQQINDLLEEQFFDLKISNDFNYTDFKTFRESYKEKCINKFSRLNFFGLSVSRRPREVELFELFVPPGFKTYDYIIDTFLENDLHPLEILDYKLPFLENPVKPILPNLFTEKSLVDMEGFFQYEFDIKPKNFIKIDFKNLYKTSDRIVVLGNPGAGKSSMIKYSICKILENDQKAFEDDDVYTYLPFRIELHRYNQVKVVHRTGFAEFLVEMLSSEYQTVVSVERLIKILTFFPCLFFFDGLDEIFDVQERIEVRNDIENFSATYPNSKIIVTSRFESYEEVRLKDDFFRLEIMNFNQGQLENYVEKWYALEEHNQHKRKSEIENCLDQLKFVDEELKYNPLLLSLILILYRNELELPTNKLSIYEGCTTTIVETRDTKEKKLNINLQINNKVSVFSALAFWQFDNANKKINNQIVQRFIKDYLIKKNVFEDERIADNAASEFLEFAKLRSIYFENKFTHKTFLEYFAAYFIFSSYYVNHKNRRRFNDILDKNLGLSSWTVVLELLICKVDANLIDSVVIEEIINKQLEKNSNDALLFFLQILKYLNNVNERIIVNLLRRAIKACFMSTFDLKESKIDHKEVLFTHLINLFNVDRLRPYVLKAYNQELVDGFLSVDGLIVFAYEFSLIANNNSLTDILKVNDRDMETPYIFLLKNHKSILGKQSYLESLKIFIETFGVAATSKVYTSYFSQNLIWGTVPFNWIITFFLSSKPEDAFENYNKLREAGVTHIAMCDATSHKLTSRDAIEPYVKLLKGLPESNYSIFLKYFIKRYYPKSAHDTQSNRKFYDVFYEKSGRNRYNK